jgi:hypothetical protein
MGLNGIINYQAYEGYPLPLLLIGTSFFITGFALTWRHAMQKQTKTQSFPVRREYAPSKNPVAKYCKFCGTENTANSMFCPNCGKAAQ